jgi:hypothetical protein
MQNSKSLIIFEHSPSDLEKQFSPELQKLEKEIFEELGNSHILEQNYVQITNIIIRIEQNNHLSEHTYRCKISLVSPTEGADFVHSVEGKDYLHNIRTAVHDLIKFVLATKEKLEKTGKYPE